MNKNVLLTIAALCLTRGMPGLAQQSLHELEAQTYAQVRTVLARALEVIPSIEDTPNQYPILGWAASLQARIGDSEEALAIAGAVASPWERDQVLFRVVGGLAQAGRLKAAREIAETIQTESSRDHALGQVAHWHASKGETEQAIESAQAISNPSRRAEALALAALAVAVRDAPVGADRIFELAIQAALEDESDTDRVRLLAEIAEFQTMAENRIAAARTLDRALATLASTQAGVEEDLARAEVVEAQAKGGFLIEAEHTAGSIKETYPAARASEQIAAAQAEAGHLDTALATIAALPESTENETNAKTAALHQLVRVQLNRGEISAALATLALMPPSHPEKAHALADVACSQAWRGDSLGSERSFRQAIEVAANVENGGMRAQAFRIISESQASVGAFTAALQTTKMIELEHELGNAFAGIAQHQARRGDAAGALEWAARLDSPYLNALALVAVAEGSLGRLERIKARTSPRPQ